MRNRGQLYLGVILVVLGIIFLLGTVFKIDLWPLCWSFGLIGLGVWLVLRPRLAPPEVDTEVSLFGEIRRRGRWNVHNEEIWHGLGDVELDFSEADIPPGETVLKFYTFVGDVEIYVPKTAGISIQTMAFVADTDLLGEKYEAFLSPVSVVSPEYLAAEKRLRIELLGFVTEIKVRQV